MWAKIYGEEITWLISIILPMSVITSEENRICFYHCLKLPKPKVTLEENQELAKNVNQ